MSTTYKLQVEKEIDKKYVMHIIFPFKTEITNDGNFCKIFHFEDYIGAVLKPGETYISKNIINFFRPFSVIEWHCNTAEYSYANHDDHPHIHKQEEVLHISLVSNNFYENPVYTESPKKIMFVPLKKGLREVREIILNPQNEKNEELKNLKMLYIYS